MRVLRVYHGGRDISHVKRDLALQQHGVEVTLVVPESWSATDAGGQLQDVGVPVIEIPVVRPGDVNRHRYQNAETVSKVIRDWNPDVVDFHEEPVSAVVHQLIPLVPEQTPICMYTAQNLDKRFPPPFASWEREALGAASGLYPCSRQAASVARGKGFLGVIRVLPLGIDESTIWAGDQIVDDEEVILGLVGRLVPEKGVRDAVHALAAVLRHREARLLIVGRGPAGPARSLASGLGIADRVEAVDWADPAELAAMYRRMHILLVPSRSTGRWVEQFGRVIVEAQAAGAVVVGYASGSIPEVTDNAGVLVREGDVESLGDAAAKLVGKDGAWADLRECGLAQVRARTWARVAAAQVEMYEEVLGKPSVHRRRPPASTRKQREIARSEFGAPATASGQDRPFAVPILRDSPRLSSVLGRLLDSTTGRFQPADPAARDDSSSWFQDRARTRATRRGPRR